MKLPPFTEDFGSPQPLLESCLADLHPNTDQSTVGPGVNVGSRFWESPSFSEDVSRFLGG